MPLAKELGKYHILNDLGIIILILGMIIGFLVVLAEPAAKILSSQVETASHGMLMKMTVTIVIAVGVSLFIGIRLYALSTGWMPIYYLIPIYIAAIVLLWFMNEDLVGMTYDQEGSQQALSSW